MKILLPLSVLILAALGCAWPDAKTNTSKIDANTQPTANSAPPTEYWAMVAAADKLKFILVENYDTADVSPFDPLIAEFVKVPKSSKEYKDAKYYAEDLTKKKAEILQFQATMGPKPETLADGSVMAVRDYLRANLNDYSSSEFVAWSPVRIVFIDKHEPYWEVVLKLRAKNGFGAYMLRTTTYYIHQGRVVKAEGLNL